ncbi:hypothetical protein EJB05_55534 [Eragrostis curvula]|uniref:Uncharacterized protein n=1 Tax=Eragrostis curvula TaxID=38414 RepID=A0A5J9SJG0_9POAL|nr:hypothetical protein EJB05_55534 [Eragrostis curvula]
MEFTFEDGKKLCALLTRQETLVNKKRRWLASMIPKPDGRTRRVKRPKFLSVPYLPELYIRSEEASCDKVRATIIKGLSSECNGYTHHLVQDSLRLFDIQGKKNVAFDPESLDIMHRTISKLSHEALQAVVCIVSHNKSSFDMTRPLMEKMIKSHLPSYRSGSLNLVTPVSSELLSAINHALDGLDGMPTQVLLAMNRKLREKSCTPKFGQLARFSKRGHVVEMVRKRCNKILTVLKEGNYLPKKLAKAMSVLNLYRKQKLRSVDISQSEFFPFTKETISMQNNILNAIWSLQKLKHDKLKLVRPILDEDSMVQRMHFKVALRNYLTECLLECDEAGLPDEALRVITFINRISPSQQVVFTEERREAEVDAVLNLSSHLKALANCCIEECSCGEEMISLGNDSCSEGNDFILSETNYLKLSSKHQQMSEPCCSNNISDTTVMRESFGGSNVGDTHSVSRPEDPKSRSEDVLRKPCERTEDFGGSGMGLDTEKSINANQLKKSRCSEITRICDETSIVAHKLIGQILDKWLLTENGVDEPTECHLGEGLVSQGQDDIGSPSSAENLGRDTLIHAVERVLPNLPKRFAPSFPYSSFAQTHSNTCVCAAV